MRIYRDTQTKNKQIWQAWVLNIHHYHFKVTGFILFGGLLIDANLRTCWKRCSFLHWKSSSKKQKDREWFFAADGDRWEQVNRRTDLQSHIATNIKRYRNKEEQIFHLGRPAQYLQCLYHAEVHTSLPVTLRTAVYLHSSYAHTATYTRRKPLSPLTSRDCQNEQIDQLVGASCLRTLCAHAKSGEHEKTARKLYNTSDTETRKTCSHMWVSWNGGTPKWRVYNGTSH